MDLVYLIGEPGSGKTTLMAELVGRLEWKQEAEPIPHIWYGDGVACQIGVRREGFAGTDGLSMSIQPKAVAWILNRPATLVLAEGDRLANDGFFKAAKRAGYALWLVYLNLPPELAVERRAARGSTQNATWLAGRVTKVKRLAERWYHLTLPAEEPPEALVDRLIEKVPALEALRFGLANQRGSALYLPRLNSEGERT
jgi:hypothetical protein